VRPRGYPIVSLPAGWARPRHPGRLGAWRDGVRVRADLVALRAVARLLGAARLDPGACRDGKRGGAVTWQEALRPAGNRPHPTVPRSAVSRGPARSPATAGCALSRRCHALRFLAW